MVAMLLKYANRSTNPLWTVTNSESGGWNKTGLLVAALYWLEYTTRPNSLHPASPMVDTKKSNDGLASAPRPAQVSRFSRYAISAGLGMLVFLLQMFVMDAGTIISWTWTGYTNRQPNGPTLHPASGWTIASACVGLLVGRSGTPRSTMWPLAGLLCALGHYSFQNWEGFYAGLGLVCYLTSMIPLYFRAASILPPASTWGKAMALNAILDVFSVVTAAYAFVPYGHLVRERTDLILGFAMIVLAAGSIVADKVVAVHTPGVSLEHVRSKRRRQNARTYGTRALAAVACAGCLLAFSLAKKTSTQPTPYFPPESKVFSGGIWTVHFGLDEDARDSQYRMKQLIEEMQVDVVSIDWFSVRGSVDSFTSWDYWRPIVGTVTMNKGSPLTDCSTSLRLWQSRPDQGHR